MSNISNQQPPTPFDTVSHEGDKTTYCFKLKGPSGKIYIGTWVMSRNLDQNMQLARINALKKTFEAVSQEGQDKVDAFCNALRENKVHFYETYTANAQKTWANLRSINCFIKVARPDGKIEYEYFDKQGNRKWLRGEQPEVLARIGNASSQGLLLYALPPEEKIRIEHNTKDEGHYQLTKAGHTHPREPVGNPGGNTQSDLPDIAQTPFSQSGHHTSPHMGGMTPLNPFHQPMTPAFRPPGRP